MSQSRGVPLPLSAADVARWRGRLVMTAACHVWMGAVGSDGYGRFSVRAAGGGGDRRVTPHQVAALVGCGAVPVGATLLHDCEVRLCCRYGPGHVRVSTQAENMRQAVARGRAMGPRPGMVDVRGRVGTSRAVQAALYEAGTSDPGRLAQVLTRVLAEGDPLADQLALFPGPAVAVPADIGFAPDAGMSAEPAPSWPLF
jgi:hypothetical protein